VSEKNDSRANFTLANLLIIGIIALYAIFWGFSASASFPAPSFVFADEDVSTIRVPPSKVDSLENDYEALEIIAGTYRGIERFFFLPDGTFEPVMSSSDIIYTFNQDRTFTVLRGETLYYTGNFTVTRAASIDDVSQLSQLSQQVIEAALETVIGRLEFDLYRIDTHLEDGFWADSHPIFFMFRTDDERVIIYEPIFGNVDVVEQVQ